MEDTAKQPKHPWSDRLLLPFFLPLNWKRLPCCLPIFFAHTGFSFLRVCSTILLPFFSFFVVFFPLPGISMSHTGTFRGTPNKTIGRGRLPDFESSSTSHIPRPRSDRPESSAASTTHTPSSDVGSGTMSAASSRQRQNQSKRDEVCTCGEVYSSI